MRHFQNNDKNIVILDRDGVINFDSPDFVKSEHEWRPIPGSIDAIVALHRAGFRVYIASNQSGLARNKFSLGALEKIHAKMESLIMRTGGKIEKIYYCPHLPEDNCLCRKPKPGMLKTILEHAGCNIMDTDFVGDSLKDIDAAIAAGCNPVLVLTGNGQKTFKTIGDAGDVNSPAFDTLLPLKRNGVIIKVFDNLLDYANNNIQLH